MADTRWRIKPAIAAHRKQHGHLLIVGQELVQFDMEWKLVQRRTFANVFMAMHAFQFAVGGSVFEDDFGKGAIVSGADDDQS